MRRAAAALALASIAWSCAPHVGPLPMPDTSSLRSRFEQQRSLRANALLATRAELAVRVDGRLTGRLPGLSVEARLASPDRVRLRGGGWFGVAADALLVPESLSVAVPLRHTTWILAPEVAAEAPVPPAQLVCRVLGADWRPSPAAWAAAVRDSVGGATVRWAEGPDSLEMWVALDGLPSRVRWWRDTRRGASVRYTDWRREGRMPWPERFSAGDDDGAVRVDASWLGVQFPRAADPDWFAIARTHRTERVDWSLLARALGRLGGVH